VFLPRRFLVANSRVMVFNALRPGQQLGFACVGLDTVAMQRCTGASPTTASVCATMGCVDDHSEAIEAALAVQIRPR